MSDNYPADPAYLRKQGTKGIMSVIGGLALGGVATLLNVAFIGPVITGALAVFGVLGLMGKSKADKSSGAVMLAAGGAGLVAILLHGPVAAVVGLGGLALLIYGGWNIFRFLQGLKTRS